MRVLPAEEAVPGVLNRKFVEQISRDSAPCDVAKPRDIARYLCALLLAWNRFRQICFFNELTTQDTSTVKRRSAAFHGHCFTGLKNELCCLHWAMPFAMQHHDGPPEGHPFQGDFHCFRLQHFGQQ